MREVNVLDLARANGQIATTDPLVMRTLQAIQASPQLAGIMTPASDPLLQSYFFLNSGDQGEKQPAVRIDYNLSDNHRLTGTYNHFFETRAQDHINGADKRFPGSPNYRQVQDDAADALDRAALDAVQQPGQRAARRHHAR